MALPHGLVCQKTSKPVPLQSIDVRLTLCHTVAQVTSNLFDQNDSDVAVEALFSFPVDDSAAVFQCDAEIDGRYITGECQDKDTAKSTYSTAVDSGHGAFLMEEHQNTGDIFRMSLGNLPPKKSATVTFSYVQELALDQEGAVEFKLPTLLNPRYRPEGDGGLVDSEPNVSYCSARDVPYTLNFKGTIDSQTEVKDVVQSSRSIQWTRQENGEILLSLMEGFDFKSELSFRVLYGNVHKPSLTVAKGNPNESGILKHDIVMLQFFPRFDSSISAISGRGEFIFIVDRSGSMNDTRIEQAKATLLIFLKSLPVGCYFNILSFGTEFSSLFKNSQEYDKKSLKEAIDLQESMDANMGGTEILKPLSHMYDKMAAIPGHPRQVFVITDGQVSNTQAVITMVQKHAHHTRVFSFGIGNAVSTALVKGIARAGKGKAELVSDLERLQPKVVSVLKLATQPKLTDLSIKWNSTRSITTMPDELPDMFHGEHLVIYGIADHSFGKEEKLSVTLSGRMDDTTIEEKVEHTMCNVDIADLSIHRVAAKRQIKLLEDRATELDNLKPKIMTLSVAANIISKHTAFVGIDRETKETIREVRNVPIPSETRVQSCLSDSYFLNSHSLSSTKSAKCFYNKSTSLGIKDRLSTMVSSVTSRFWSGGSTASQDQSVRSDPVFSNTELNVEMKGDNFHEAERSPFGNNDVQFVCRNKSYAACTPDIKRPSSEIETATKTALPLEQILALQEYDGCWNLNETLADFLNTELKILKENCPGESAKAWATALVLAWLETHCGDQFDEWIMIASKAEMWLKHNQTSTGFDTGCNLVETAKKYIK